MNVLKQIHNSRITYMSASAVALALFIVSYVTFTFYRPKAVIKLSDVQGFTSENTLAIAYPSGSKEISVDKTSYGRKVTLEASRTVSELYNYYKNIFDAKGWEVEYSDTADGMMITKYKDRGNFVTVTISKQPNLNNTIVILDEVRAE